MKHPAAQDDSNRQLLELLAIPGVAGYEDRVRSYLEERVARHGTPSVDAMGNLSVTIGEGRPRLLIVAHMDEIGLTVSGIDEDGLVHFEKLGTIDDRILSGSHVVIHGANGPVPGVVGAVPPHHGGSQGSSAADLAIDLGAASASEVRGFGVEVLNQVTFHKEARILNGNRLNCRGIDDRVGCALVLWALEHAAAKLTDAAVTFAWSVQEEVGLRGAHAMKDQRIAYDAVIPVDACATSNAPAHSRRIANFPLGAGPVLRMIDHGSIASPVLGAWLEQLAERAGIPLQKGVTGGETDGVPLQLSGAHMVPLTVPMRYVHSLAETADLRDIAAARKLLELVVTSAGQLPAS